MSNQDVVTVTIEDENEEVQVEEPKKNIFQKGIDFINEHKAIVIGAVAVAASVVGGMLMTKSPKHRLGSGDDCDFDDEYYSDEYYDDDFDDNSSIDGTEDTDK